MAIYDVSTTEKKASPSLVAGGTLYADNPLGTILPFGSANIPTGWLLCDGTAISRTTYSELFAVIGTAFGSGDGSTTFNLPDMRESVPKGAGLTGKTVGAHLDADGLQLGEFLDDRVKNVTLKSGDVQIYSGAGHDRGLVAGGSADRTLGNYSTSSVGDTTEVKSVGVNYIIKAKMIGVPADLASGVEEYINDNAKSEISSSNKLVTESDLNKVITVTTPDNNIVIADSRLITDNLVMVSGYIKSGTQLAFDNTSQVQIGKLSVSGRTIRGSGPCSLFLFSNDLFGTNGPNTIPAIWKAAQGWITIGINITNTPRLYEDSWFTVMLPLE